MNACQICAFIDEDGILNAEATERRKLPAYKMAAAMMIWKIATGEIEDIMSKGRE